MKKELRSSAEIRSELEQSEAAVKRLRERIESLEEQLKRANEELLTLAGSGWNRDRGKIGTLCDELKDADRWEADRSAKVVIWEVPPRFDRDEELIVSRVTPKRIFVRRRGAPVEDQYNRDGTKVGAWDNRKIDVAATLGDSA